MRFSGARSCVHSRAAHAQKTAPFLQRERRAWSRGCLMFRPPPFLSLSVSSKKAFTLRLPVIKAALYCIGLCRLPYCFLILKPFSLFFPGRPKERGYRGPKGEFPRRRFFSFLPFSFDGCTTYDGLLHPFRVPFPRVLSSPGLCFFSPSALRSGRISLACSSQDKKLKVCRSALLWGDIIKL